MSRKVTRACWNKRPQKVFACEVCRIYTAKVKIEDKRLCNNCYEEKYGKGNKDAAKE